MRASRLLPNAKGPRKKRRKFLACVVLFQLLYRAPIWSPTISARAMNHMSSVARRVMLRVATCYRTVSYVVAVVVASIPPLELLAGEKAEIYRGLDRGTARDRLLHQWQLQWNVSTRGWWIFRIIGDLQAWFNRKHGEIYIST